MATAHAKCWTTETKVTDGGHWRRGHISLKCQSGDPVGCTCFSPWLVRHKCRDQHNRHHADSFAPVHGRCVRRTPNHAVQAGIGG